MMKDIWLECNCAMHARTVSASTILLAESKEANCETGLRDFATVTPHAPTS